jgi:hypothetical protein
MPTRDRAVRRPVQVVRTRKPGPQGRHLTLAYLRARQAQDEGDLSALVLYGQG